MLAHCVAIGPTRFASQQAVSIAGVFSRVTPRLPETYVDRQALSHYAVMLLQASACRKLRTPQEGSRPKTPLRPLSLVQPTPLTCFQG